MQRKMLTDEEIYKVVPQFFSICGEKIEVIIKNDITIGEDDEMETRYGQSTFFSASFLRFKILANVSFGTICTLV